MSDTATTTSTAAAPATPVRSHWSGYAGAAEREHWTAVAEGVAKTLASDVLERDRAGANPVAEAALLKESGLVTLLDPVEFGGGGGHWETAFLATRIIARVDASIAQLLGYHYINSSNIALVAPAEQREAWFRASVEGRWIWGDSVNPVDPNLDLADNGDGTYTLTGLKRFSTGSSVGDALLVNAVVSGGDNDGRFAFIVLPHGHEGVEYVDDWDYLGQRLSASGSVRYHDVQVSGAELLGFGSDDPFETLVTPGIQLLFGNLYLGIAEGALSQGREITLARQNAWFLSGADRYKDDPFIKRLYGEFVSRTAAVEALADKVNRRYDEVVAEGHLITAESRGRLEIEVAQLKVVSSELGVDVANRVFEATGSSSTANKVGLDLFWRNVRTHSLHDPIDYKKFEVGAYYLSGELQPISLYT